jgi:protein-S-isoprenylcysteine O-methyltransferase Ste14
MNEAYDHNSRDWMLWLKLAAFTLLCGGTVAVIIPALLLRWADGRAALGLGSAQYIGFLPLIVGIVFYLFCSIQLLVIGGGIPAPLDPTRRLIASGPYAMVRNPMYLAATLFFWGQAILMNSSVLVAYTLLMMLLYYLGWCGWRSPHWAVASARRTTTTARAYHDGCPRYETCAK